MLRRLELKKKNKACWHHALFYLPKGFTAKVESYLESNDKGHRKANCPNFKDFCIMDVFFDFLLALFNELVLHIWLLVMIQWNYCIIK